MIHQNETLRNLNQTKASPDPLFMLRTAQIQFQNERFEKMNGWTSLCKKAGSCHDLGKRMISDESMKLMRFQEI